MLMFSVQACHSAMISLSSVPGSEISHPEYRITIGGENNMQSSIIRTDMGLEGRFDTPNILDCDAFKTFWLFWRDGKVQVGEGSTLGDNRIGELNDDAMLNVNGISIATDATTGYWQIPINAGLYISMNISH